MMRALFATACIFSIGCAPATSGSPPADLGAAPDLAPLPPGDATPTGAISFFKAKQCPPGWSPWAPAGGRFLVPTVGSARGGVTQGTALTNGEDRPHQHTLSATIAVGSVNYVGIAGEANHGVGVAGNLAFNATAEPVSSGIPYVQLLACHKDDPPQPGTHPIPPGVLLFFDGASCPDGWSQAAATQGRHLVGVPPRGTPGLAFGGPALANGEQRAHQHPFAGTLSTTPHGIALASGCCAGGYAQNGNLAYSGVTELADANLPYLQLLQCEKQ